MKTKKINLDPNIYNQFLRIRSHSRNMDSQFKVSELFKKLATENNTKEYNYNCFYDEIGNFYLQKTKIGHKENYVPCVVAHLDINQSVTMYPYDINYAKDGTVTGRCKATGKPIGLGHDDKAGVYFALLAVQELDNVKVALFVDEEIGGVGSNKPKIEFFENVSYITQLDRRGGNDVSEETNGITVVTELFKNDSIETLNRYGMFYKHCIYTDVGNLVGMIGICGINVSCGYENEHRDTESLNTNLFENSATFAIELMKQLGYDQTYPISRKEMSGNYSNWLDSYYDTTPKIDYMEICRTMDKTALLELIEQATELGHTIEEHLDYCGVLDLEGKSDDAFSDFQPIF